MKARKKVSNFVKLIDIFGQPINFTVDGHSRFNTLQGSALSLVVLVLITFQSIKKYGILMNREDTNFT